MRTRGQELGDEIFLLGIEIDDAHAATPLAAIFARVRPLDVPALREHQDRFFIGDQILGGKYGGTALHYFRTPIVAVLLDDLAYLFLDKLHELLFALQERREFLDKGLHLFQFVLYLFALEARELLQAHIEDGLRLELGEFEYLHQSRASLVDIFGLLDELDDLINMVERLLEAEQDMLTRLRDLEVVARALRDHIFAVRDEVFEQCLERERLRHPIDERDHVVVECLLYLRMLIQIIQDRLRVGVVLELNDDADVFGRLIAQVAEALELFLVY